MRVVIAASIVASSLAACARILELEAVTYDAPAATDATSMEAGADATREASADAGADAFADGARDSAMDAAEISCALVTPSWCSTQSNALFCADFDDAVDLATTDGAASLSGNASGSGDAWSPYPSSPNPTEACVAGAPSPPNVMVSNPALTDAGFTSAVVAANLGDPNTHTIRLEVDFDFAIVGSMASADTAYNVLLTIRQGDPTIALSLQKTPAPGGGSYYLLCGSFEFAPGDQATTLGCFSLPTQPDGIWRHVATTLYGFGDSLTHVDISLGGLVPDGSAITMGNSVATSAFATPPYTVRFGEVFLLGGAPLETEIDFDNLAVLLTQ